MKLKAIIVEDEKQVADNLRSMLVDNCGQIEIVASCENAENAYESIQQHNPDIVFLDVEMPGESGLELLKRFDGIHFEIIFTTAYQEFAIEAIKFSALDYLMKPIDPDELTDAVDKAISKKNYAKDIGIETLLSNLKQNEVRQLVIPDAQGATVVQVSDVVRCEADKSYTEIHLIDNNRIVSSKPLSEYESMLESHNFYRAHHSHLINLNHVKRYVKGEGGYVIMSDDSQVEISRRRKATFITKLNSL